MRGDFVDKLTADSGAGRWLSGKSPPPLASASSADELDLFRAQPQGVTAARIASTQFETDLVHLSFSSRLRMIHPTCDIQVPRTQCQLLQCEKKPPMAIGRRGSTEVSDPKEGTPTPLSKRGTQKGRSVALDLELDLFRLQSQGVPADRAASMSIWCVTFGL